MAIITIDQLKQENAGRLVEQGKLVRLARGIYSDEVLKPPEQIVRESWREILGRTMPGAVITDRSGFSGHPVDGHLFVHHPRTRVIELPGLTIVPAKGLPAQPGDVKLGNDVFLASEQRALVDNARATRSKNGLPSRTLSRAEMHDHIVHLNTTRTPVQRQRLLDAVSEYASQTQKPLASADVTAFFNSAAGKLPTMKSKSKAMRAAQSGNGFDQRRVQMFTTLAEKLEAEPPRIRPARADRPLLPFFESYFSNYIEGTEFTVEEAAEIALHGHIPEYRPADAHDIAGTYRIVNDRAEMEADLSSYEAFREALRRRHRAVMEGRPERGPGQFKTTNNRAGLTEFVAAEHVEGTLQEGWEILDGIRDPFARSAYMMFFVSEVHPFTDGNGRLARIMMNSELSRTGQTRVIIPTVLRLEYLSALTSLTHNGRAEGLITVLDFAQRYTAQTDFSTLESATQMLTTTNAFEESATAAEQGKRIILPSQLPLGWEFAQPDQNRGATDTDPFAQTILDIAGEDQ